MSERREMLRRFLLLAGGIIFCTGILVCAVMAVWAEKMEDRYFGLVGALIAVAGLYGWRRAVNWVLLHP